MLMERYQGLDKTWSSTIGDHIGTLGCVGNGVEIAPLFLCSERLLNLD